MRINLSQDLLLQDQSWKVSGGVGFGYSPNVEGEELGGCAALDSFISTSQHGSSSASVGPG